MLKSGFPFFLANEEKKHMIGQSEKAKSQGKILFKVGNASCVFMAIKTSQLVPAVAERPFPR